MGAFLPYGTADFEQSSIETMAASSVVISEGSVTKHL